MRKSKDVGRLAGLTGTALAGVIFFFIIMGAFGLRFAIAGWWYLYSVQLLSVAHFRPTARNYETRSFHSRQNSVCLYGKLSHHFSDDVNWSGCFSSSGRSALAEN